MRPLSNDDMTVVMYRSTGSFCYTAPSCNGGYAVLRQVEKLSPALGLVHPHDRHGALLKDRVSSAELDAALEAYRQACARASEDVRDRLRSLARSLMVRR